MKIPTKFVNLCRDWHDGQSSMMYAVSSGGALTRGSIRPHDDDGPYSDEKWIWSLFASLESEIRHCLRLATVQKDRNRLAEFLAWTEAKTVELASKFS